MHSAAIQKAKLQRNRKYDDELQRYDRQHPANAPKWAYIDQTDVFFDTDIEPSKSAEEHADEEEENEEVVNTGCSAATAEQAGSDSDHLEMDA